MSLARVTVLVLLAGACATKPATTTATAPTPTTTTTTAPASTGTTHVVKGTAETIKLSCGTPPYHQPAPTLAIYLGGTLGDAVTGQPYAVAAVSARKTFETRLPAGRYCLSTGGDAPICEAEIVLPTPPGADSSVWVSRRIPNQARCDY